MIKVDLHTHSTESPDGGLNESDYNKALLEHNLDVIAVTDHDTISFARRLQSQKSLTNSIIVGCEISSTDGDIIGLFLSKPINAGMSAKETAQAIRDQSGFVLAPHPADPNRNGLSFECMDEFVELIDGVEILNGRILGTNSPAIRLWASKNGIAQIAASDAHSYSGIGKTYTTLPSMPKDAADLRLLLASASTTSYQRPPLHAFLAPKLNRLLKLIRGIR